MALDKTVYGQLRNYEPSRSPIRKPAEPDAQERIAAALERIADAVEVLAWPIRAPDVPYPS